MVLVQEVRRLRAELKKPISRSKPSPKKQPKKNEGVEKES